MALLLRKCPNPEIRFGRASDVMKDRGVTIIFPWEWGSS